MEDYTELYGKRMTPEEYDEFCRGLREDLHRIGQIGDEERTKIEIYRLFARLNGHRFPQASTAVPPVPAADAASAADDGVPAEGEQTSDEGATEAEE